MDPWLQDLRNDLLDREERDLRRRLRPVTQQGRWLHISGGAGGAGGAPADAGGRRLLNLAGNDYLGLSTHPRLIAAAAQAAREHGVGAQASRLVSGHTTVHAQVEASFAAFKHAEAALLCPTGYMANLAATEKLARLLEAHAAGNAERRATADPQAGSSGEESDDVDGAAGAPASRGSARPPRRFIVTDSVFSMDGDAADLPALCDLADRHDAILIVDEAHGTGLLGPEGSGLAELQGVASRVDVVVSTASKALGGLGGIVTARREIIETLVNRARSFVYTTAIPPAQAAAIGAAVEVIRDEPERRRRVLALSARLRERAGGLPWLAQPIPGGSADRVAPVVTPIVPLIVGSAATALALAAHLEAAGFYAPAIRPPTVPPGAARVRVTLRADLEDADLDRLLAALGAFRPAKA
ncbi:MAG: aminotransferase class I/II-fold pyridoxal phosphate-dependent enzyme [Planctomycetota bacterium]|nr:aminotransferase class I/II-fold pyridoxal phosphate-dependent enzyme [Planctomycetota bacterium]